MIMPFEPVKEAITEKKTLATLKSTTDKFLVSPWYLMLLTAIALTIAAYAVFRMMLQKRQT